LALDVAANVAMLRPGGMPGFDKSGGTSLMRKTDAMTLPWI